MNKATLIFIMALFIGCFFEKKPKAALFVTNQSLEDFDQALLEISIKDKLVFSDSIQNCYISYHWEDSMIDIPSGSFKLTATVKVKDYELRKDTIITYKDSLQVFVKFNFSPFYKRYDNPEIYKYIEGEISNLRELADSLYQAGVLSNADEYLNDTIPPLSSLTIDIK